MLPSVLLLLIAAPLGFAQGQPASPSQVPTIRERVEVIATRLPETPDEVPVAIEVITGEELRNRGVTDLKSALALATGIDLSPGGDGGPASAVPELWGQIGRASCRQRV